MIVYYIIMNLDTEQTIWKTKKTNIKSNIEGMDSIHHKKHKHKKVRSSQPANLIALPLQSVDLQNHKLASTDYGTSVIVEGFNQKNPCASIGEIFKPYIKFVDYAIVWLIDKPCIEYPTVFIEFVGRTICEFGTELSSPPNPDTCDTTIKIDTSDKELIKSQFKIFLSIGISCFIVYNWYYLMFYDLLGRVFTQPISSSYLSSQNTAIGFIFKYLIQPISLVNWIALDILPKKMNILSNSRVIFICLFLLIMSIVQSNGASIMLSFSNYLKRQTDSYSGIMITIMIMSGLFSVFIAVDKLSHATLLGGITEFAGLSQENTLTNAYKELSNFASTSSIFFVPQLLSFIMRITFSIILVWIAGIMVFGYILLYSFFAIPVYSSNSLKDTFNEINRSINTSNTAPNLFESNKYYKTFNWFIEKIFTYFYEIVFIIFFFQGIINYSANIKHAGLKPIIVSMAGLGLLITAYILYYRYKLLQSSVSIEPEQENTDTSINPTHTLNKIVEPAEIIYPNKIVEPAEIISK